jgi:pimeloyl-ACP methyl ester carboxylesterase
MSDTAVDWIEVTGSESAVLASCAVGEGVDFLWGHSLLGSMAQEDASGVLGWTALQDIARVIRYDARGHGQSEATADANDYSWPQLAGNMWQVADYYGANSAILGGASMGCATALHAACQQPDRVRALVLVIPPTAWAERRDSAVNYRRAASFLRFTRGMPIRMLRWLPKARPGAGFKDAMVRETLRYAAASESLGVITAMRGAALSDLPEPDQLSQLSMPVLILAWPDDPVHPLSTAHKLADLLPNAELHISKDPAQPWQWADTVRNFLQQLD